MAKKVLAFTGKGGVGKTSLCALMVLELAKRYPDKKILAIDADPAVGLSTALGINVKHTVNDIRIEFVSKLLEKERPSVLEIMNDARYELTDTILDCGNYCFLAIGRPEGAGCYCSVNNLLKDVISEISDCFDYVLIDGEAGIEQINRRVMEKVTDLVLVSDASKKGIDVIKKIKSVASDMEMYSKDHAIINRARSKEIVDLIDLNGLNLIGCVGLDDELELLDVKGESLSGLKEGSKLLSEIDNILDKMEL